MGAEMLGPVWRGEVAGQRPVDVRGGEETGSVGWWGRLGTAGRRRGWDGWPGQRRLDVGGVRREGVSGGWWMWRGE